MYLSAMPSNPYSLDLMFADTLPIATSSILMQEGAQPFIPSPSMTSEYAPVGTRMFNPANDLAPSMQQPIPVASVGRGRVIGAQNVNGEIYQLDVETVVGKRPARISMPMLLGLAAVIFYVVKRK